ncbi:hypothetical protein PIB30_035783 [Stylosanthes scabra]|uniref:Uncharacterized protein n=1 Tax=Stylosanthes scabra TaxID=79078 RepID=A0ABU6UGJ3_9FABA|nr:hypothetical protein [Stylosanthes scabra]
MAYADMPTGATFLSNFDLGDGILTILTIRTGSVKSTQKGDTGCLGIASTFTHHLLPDVNALALCDLLPPRPTPPRPLPPPVIDISDDNPFDTSHERSTEASDSREISEDIRHTFDNSMDHSDLLDIADSADDLLDRYDAGTFPFIPPSP